MAMVLVMVMVMMMVIGGNGDGDGNWRRFFFFQKFFLCTISSPSSNSCREIFISENVGIDANIDPPIHAAYRRYDTHTHRWSVRTMLYYVMPPSPPFAFTCDSVVMLIGASGAKALSSSFSRSDKPTGTEMEMGGGGWR